MVDPAKKTFQLNQCWIWIYVKQGIISILFLLFIIIIDRRLCTNGMLIVGRWCSTPFTEAKETLDYVPELVKFDTCTRYH